MMSYSQGDEEKYILEAVGDVPGRFMDIGAYDGKTFSNTLALVERGWSGILVEPGLEAFAALLKRHGENPKLTLVHAAVGLTSGLALFWNSPDAVSTMYARHYRKWKNKTSFSGCFFVPTIQLDALLGQLGGPIDFLNIDTEGSSADLFLQFPLSTYKPRAVCVEHDGRIAECSGRAKGCGYRPTYTNAENLVLVKE